MLAPTGSRVCRCGRRDEKAGLRGGTALRFLYGLSRFSEDLEFALERPEHDRGLRSVARAIKRDFELSGHDVEVTLRTARAVHSADLKFPGLLHETGLPSARSAPCDQARPAVNQDEG